MGEASLDDLMSMNEHLTALVAAGVPLDIGISQRSLPATLAQFNANIARRVSRGVRLEDALADTADSVSPEYLRFAELAARTGDFPVALGEATTSARSVGESRHLARLAFTYPFMVCALAYLGFIGLCVYLVPTLERAIASFGLSPGFGMKLLAALSDSLPYWVAIPPLCVIIWIARRRWSLRRTASGGAPFAWLPAQSQTVVGDRNAAFANSLATLLDHDLPLVDSLPLAANASEDQNLQSGAKFLAGALKENTLPPEDSPAAQCFPPFLRWALWHSEETVGRAESLRLAADVYRAASERRQERLRLTLPIMACVVVSGGAVLLFGLAIFGPLAEILFALAK